MTSRTNMLVLAGWLLVLAGYLGEAFSRRRPGLELVHEYTRNGHVDLEREEEGASA